MHRNTIPNIIITGVILLSLLLGAVSVAVASYSTIAGTAGNGDTYLLGYKPVIVITGSMEPAIKINSVSIAKKCPIKDIKLGDIIMYRSASGMLITHRVISILDVDGGKALITKGDANKYQDTDPVTEDSIKSKVVYTANYMVPIISAIMPEPGVVNTMVIIKSLILLLAITILIWGSIVGIVKVAMQVYWIHIGDIHYQEILDDCSSFIKIDTEIHDILSNDRHEAESKFSLIDKIEIGMYRSYIASRINDIKKSSLKLQRSTNRYHTIYSKAIVKGAKKQLNKVTKLKDMQTQITNTLENEEQIHTQLYEAAKIRVSHEHSDDSASQKT